MFPFIRYSDKARGLNEYFTVDGINVHKYFSEPCVFNKQVSNTHIILPKSFRVQIRNTTRRGFECSQSQRPIPFCRLTIAEIS